MRQEVNKQDLIYQDCYTRIKENWYKLNFINCSFFFEMQRVFRRQVVFTKKRDLPLNIETR